MCIILFAPSVNVFTQNFVCAFTSEVKLSLYCDGVNSTFGLIFAANETGFPAHAIKFLTSCIPVVTLILFDKTIVIPNALPITHVSTLLSQVSVAFMKNSDFCKNLSSAGETTTNLLSIGMLFKFIDCETAVNISYIFVFDKMIGFQDQPFVAVSISQSSTV